MSAPAPTTTPARAAAANKAFRRDVAPARGLRNRSGPLPCAPERMGAEVISSDMAERALDLETAIALRWALRDIVAQRTRLLPVKPDHLQTLLDLGMVEM